MKTKNVAKNILSVAIALILTTACGASSDNMLMKKESLDNKIVSAFTEENSSDDLSPIVANGSYSEEKKETTILSEFSTSFKHPKKSRANNILLAAIAVDQKIILPNETFSFNDTVGPTSKKRGYMLGKIFIKGRDAKGYGGGVCQVSSTIYNAAVLADLQIVERHAHSKPVGYVKEGNDAATSFGGKDFKFLNNKPYPIKIDSYIKDENIYIAIEKA